MPEYQYVQVGLRPETIDRLDEIDISRSQYIRELVEDSLE